jgi:hypothetical protein
MGNTSAMSFEAQFDAFGGHFRDKACCKNINISEINSLDNLFFFFKIYIKCNSFRIFNSFMISTTDLDYRSIFYIFTYENIEIL